MKIRALDIIIILFLFILLTSFIFYNFVYKKSGDALLLIETQNDSFIYSMNQKKIIKIKGELGITVIEINMGKFRFVDSPCMHKDCIKTGWVSIHNFPVICLPNKVSAYIINKDAENIIDSVTR